MRKIKRQTVFYAIGKDCDLRHPQRVTNWYWDVDCTELVFCTNTSDHKAFHYTVANFVDKMIEIFGDIDPSCNTVDFDGKSDSFVFTTK